MTISLGDIQNTPTRWVLALFVGFLNCWSVAPDLSFRGGGGYVYTFSNL